MQDKGIIKADFLRLNKNKPFYKFFTKYAKGSYSASDIAYAKALSSMYTHMLIYAETRGYLTHDYNTLLDLDYTSVLQNLYDFTSGKYSKDESFSKLNSLFNFKA